MSVTGIDILPESVALAERAAVENGLTDRLTFRQGDLRQVRSLFSPGSFDLVVCNPPYYPPTSGKLSADSALRSARAEVSCTLEDVCQAAAHLLRWGGSFCLVHKPERLADLCCTLRSNGLEPKRLREVCKQAGSAPSLLLMEGRRGGKPGLTIQAPLLLQTADGSPTAELDAIYFRSTEDTP
jgi:tRNA1(Val) A37 N6-methylase TrmN6